MSEREKESGSFMGSVIAVGVGRMVGLVGLGLEKEKTKRSQC